MSYLWNNNMLYHHNKNISVEVLEITVAILLQVFPFAGWSVLVRSLGNFCNISNTFYILSAYPAFVLDSILFFSLSPGYTRVEKIAYYILLHCSHRVYNMLLLYNLPLMLLANTTFALIRIRIYYTHTYRFIIIYEYNSVLFNNVYV